jgi:hypothetical protein
MTDVRRILRMRDDKVAAQLLLQKGTVGDELWSLLLKAEKELEAEVLDVVNEANTFSNAWGPGIFATAGEMCIREKTAVDWNLLPEGPLPTRTSLETCRLPLAWLRLMCPALSPCALQPSASPSEERPARPRRPRRSVRRPSLGLPLPLPR